MGLEESSGVWPEFGQAKNLCHWKTPLSSDKFFSHHSIKRYFDFTFHMCPPLWANIYYYLFLTSTATSSFSTWHLLYLCSNSTAFSSIFRPCVFTLSYVSLFFFCYFLVISERNRKLYCILPCSCSNKSHTMP